MLLKSRIVLANLDSNERYSFISIKLCLATLSKTVTLTIKQLPHLFAVTVNTSGILATQSWNPLGSS
jgi:hypothetical protein